jgi:hypothetical protein
LLVRDGGERISSMAMNMHLSKIPALASIAEYVLANRDERSSLPFLAAGVSAADAGG